MDAWSPTAALVANTGSVAAFITLIANALLA